VTQGTRFCARLVGPCVTPGARSSGWLGEHGVPGYSGNPDFRVTLGTWISAWLREPGVPGYSGNPEFGWLRESCVLVTPVSRNSGRLRVPGVPGDFNSGLLKSPGSSGYRIHPRFPKSPRTLVSRSNTGFPKSSGSPGSLELSGVSRNLRRNPELQVPGVNLFSRCQSVFPESPRFPEVTRNCRFPVSPAAPCDSGPRSSGWIKEPGGTPRTLTSEWFREPGVPSDSGNSEFRAEKYLTLYVLYSFELLMMDGKTVWNM